MEGANVPRLLNGRTRTTTLIFPPPAGAILTAYVSSMHWTARRRCSQDSVSLPEAGRRARFSNTIRSLSRDRDHVGCEHERTSILLRRSSEFLVLVCASQTELSLLRNVNKGASCGMDKFPVASCDVGRWAIDRRRLQEE